MLSVGSPQYPTHGDSDLHNSYGWHMETISGEVSSKNRGDLCPAQIDWSSSVLQISFLQQWVLHISITLLLKCYVIYMNNVTCLLKTFLLPYEVLTIAHTIKSLLHPVRDYLSRVASHVHTAAIWLQLPQSMLSPDFILLHALLICLKCSSLTNNMHQKFNPSFSLSHIISFNSDNSSEVRVSLSPFCTLWMKLLREKVSFPKSHSWEVVAYICEHSRDSRVHYQNPHTLFPFFPKM